MPHQEPEPRRRKERLRHWLVGDDVDYGCAYCADDQNRSFGHVTQVASNDASGMLLQCPRCGTLYQDIADGSPVRRVTPEAAGTAFPGWVLE
jgi:hypothetical protein